MTRTILVVDDDADVRSLIVRILRSRGLMVVGEAGTVADALERADALRPDTALVDLGLPDGDGFSLTRQLCARPWPIRVVIFSSDADRTNAATAGRAGAVGFLLKEELSGPGLLLLIGGEAEGDD